MSPPSLPDTSAITANADAIDRACARIAPAWPLDRLIAVNPFWGMVDQPFPEVAAKLRSLSGARLLMPRVWYREAYREGRLHDRHLVAAIELADARTSLDDLRALLDRDEPSTPTRPRVVDVADRAAAADAAGESSAHDRSLVMTWRTFVTHNVSQLCAAYFDEDQATVGPDRTGGLYATWRRHALVDRTPSLLMGASLAALGAEELPTTARATVDKVLDDLEVPSAQRETYLWGLLLDQNGWASSCAYRRWTARLSGSDDDTIVELLAIRLAWEWLLHRAGGEGFATAWQRARESWAHVDEAAATSRQDDWLLQAAMEIAWREPVTRALVAGFAERRPSGARVQAVFCIDVRSEPFRRALEGTSPHVQTLGFAGFFGVPADYLPTGTSAARPQLPGLLAPQMRASDVGVSEGAATERGHALGRVATWHAFRTDPLASFAFVETLGLTYAAKLLSSTFGWNRPRSVDEAGLSAEANRARKPRLLGTTDGAPLDVAARADLAEAMLRGMSLAHPTARLVLLVGHASSCRNNPQAAGLACGACGGQSGEINARLAAALLDEPAVRTELAKRGRALPDDVRFVAGLHDTTTDEVALFDLDELPASHEADLADLRRWLHEAGDRARAERAPRLGIAPMSSADLLRTLRAKSNDWAETRPEWGLTDNAALIVAPRERSRSIDLRGRVFLHEYRHEEDAGYAVLEKLMTAPVLVAHWINLQYYASTVDHARYGSGNKLLHNVVGGRLGVFEGNGGDLRIGLALQSVHDGVAWRHTPLRLTVFVEAPRTAIETIVSKHAVVRALVDNDWLTLVQLDDAEQSAFTYRAGQWLPARERRDEP